MTLSIHTDGGSKGNPGPSSIGILITSPEGELARLREDIGIATNNVAEYTAVIRAYELIKKLITEKSLSISQLKFYSDSQLIVRQLSGLYKVKNPSMKSLVNQVKALELSLGIPVTYTSVPREENSIADDLVNGVI